MRVAIHQSHIVLFEHLFDGTQVHLMSAINVPQLAAVTFPHYLYGGLVVLKNDKLDRPAKNHIPKIHRRQCLGKQRSSETDNFSLSCGTTGMRLHLADPTQRKPSVRTC